MRVAHLPLILILIAPVIYASPSAQNTAVALSEHDVHTPFDKLILSIFSPDSNQHRDQIDTISVLISSSFSNRQFLLSETGLSTGIFEDEIQLSPDLSRFPGDIQTRRDDGLSVSFRIDSDTVVTRSIFINYHTGSAFFDKASYSLGEQARIIVEDRDMNRNPDTLDTVSARVWSSTDRGGLFVTLRETGGSTGLFEEIVTFTLDDATSGTRLRVSEGDALTLKYTDNTLPPPAALAADGIETVEVREIFANSFFGEQIPAIERAPASDPILLDSSGEAVSQIFTGDYVLIESEVTNRQQSKKQPFAFIVQVKDSGDVTSSLSWITTELPAGEALRVSQSWLPPKPGEYSVEVFVWEGVNNPVALSPVRDLKIKVLE